MKTYELMYIAKGALDFPKVQKQVEGYVEKLEGKILKSEFLGKKKLAYAIGSFIEGLYGLINFNVPEAKILDLKNLIKADNDIIRDLITVVKESSGSKIKSKK